MSVLIEQAIYEYDYSDIRPTDIVLDIGAAVGGFSLLASKMCEKVYAIEPLFCDELNKNKWLNNSMNVEILAYALSDVTEKEIVKFEGREMVVESKTFIQLLDIVGGHVDFLKCDCEGAEWYLQPSDFDGIRRVEMEVHSHPKKQKSEYISMLESCGYNVKVDKRTKHTWIAHCLKTKGVERMKTEGQIEKVEEMINEFEKKQQHTKNFEDIEIAIRNFMMQESLEEATKVTLHILRELAREESDKKTYEVIHENSKKNNKSIRRQQK